MVSKEEAFSYWEYLCASEKNLNGFAEARDVSETIIKCTFYIHKERKTAWKAVPERCDGQIIVAW